MFKQDGGEIAQLSLCANDKAESSFRSREKTSAIMARVRCVDILQQGHGFILHVIDLLRRHRSRHGTGEAVLGDLEDHGRKRTEGGFQLHGHKFAHARWAVPTVFFIFLELFKSLVEYFREHRLKLTFIVGYLSVYFARGHDQSLPT